MSATDLHQGLLALAVILLPLLLAWVLVAWSARRKHGPKREGRRPAGSSDGRTR